MIYGHAGDRLSSLHRCSWQLVVSNLGLPPKNCMLLIVELHSMSKNLPCIYKIPSWFDWEVV